MITVCNREADEACPVFPGVQQRTNWFFFDPQAFTGSREQELAQVRELRDSIRARLVEFFRLL